MVTLRSKLRETKGPESVVDICVICREDSQRLTVSCAGCLKVFHLGCLTPPLRSRSQLPKGWQCFECNKEGDGLSNKVITSGKRMRRKDTDNAAEQEERPTPKRLRRATRFALTTEQEEKRTTAKTLPKRRSGKASMKKQIKHSNENLAAFSSSFQLRDDEDEVEDDSDSDFVDDSASEKGTDDEHDKFKSSSSDDEKPNRAKGPHYSRKSSRRVRILKAFAKQKRKTIRATPATDSSQIATNNNTDAGEADSFDAEVVRESESSEDQEEYKGPKYFIEYAPNARAKCKSCEQKLLPKQIRVGIRIRHSIFGDTTYYKHLECTAIGMKAGFAANQLNEEDSNTGDTITDQKTVTKTKPSNEAIAGLSKLRNSDRNRVRDYMHQNDLDGVIDERLPLSDDHFDPKNSLPEKEPSKYLTATLLPYQREALGWMVAQEESDYKGGILADEMGMGKTIQAISLILENLREVDPSSYMKQKVTRGGTLVVCPLVATMQWKSEIERFVEAGHLSVYIHHGPKRLETIEQIASYDIVLTTYSIIESEIRKTLGWSKVACKYCGKKYLPDKLVSHNKYFCGPDAKKTALQNKQLKKKSKKKEKKVAGESSEDEEAISAKKGFQRRNHRSKARSKKEDKSESTRQKAKVKSPLHQIMWTRIILDEAHYIKDRKCNTARGIFELKSNYKWCLTGTPLQNRIGELFSLVRFLRVKKYAYYHCSVCDCQMLDYNFPDRQCVQCPHSAIQHYSYFNKKVVIPIQAYGYVAEGKLAMQRLQNDVLQHILLRRTKEGRADDISLPPKLVRIRKDRLDERESDFYEAIYTQSQAQFNTYVSSGTLLNNYAHIFDLLIRLRQAVDHPYLVIYSKSNPAVQLPSSAAPLVEEQPFCSGGGSSSDDEKLCPICHEDMEDSVVAKCGHAFCRECVKEFIESLPSGGEATCLSCSKPLTVDLSLEVHDTGSVDIFTEVANLSNSRSTKALDPSSFHRHSILRNLSDIHAFQSSTKIEALMQELDHMRSRDPSGKAIVFSQFVNMLDIIQHRLHIGGVNCVKLSGNMSMNARDQTIQSFRDDPTISVFLISLKAGGVALNLTVASHIFLMDPWWNPAAEHQAIDRTHRLGQFKPIHATRFIIAGTVEERILKLQEKKRLIFEGTVGANVSAICRLTEEDLRFLFAT